jgi:hypothetical protein
VCSLSISTEVDNRRGGQVFFDQEEPPTLEQSHSRWLRNHKVSADKQWLDYQYHIWTYPDKVTFKDKSWVLYDMYCGKRNDPDTLYFIREVSKHEAMFDEEFNPRRHSWYWPRYVVNETTGVYFEVESRDIHWFKSLENPYDLSFSRWINKYTPTTTTTKRRVTMSRSSGWCDDPLSYEVNEHSMSVDVSKAGKTIRLELSECTELASFLATAKEKIKEAKIASLKEQQDALQKALREVETL